ncbi:probable ELAV-like protein 2 [Coccomyxa sp. Obi]|nr:probable ELAV-like protein 2 [Coccomyxa sp. Obi]
MHANLYVRNLPTDLDEGTLQQLFQSFGALECCRVVREASSGKSCGYGFVKFSCVSSAEAAIKGVSGARLSSNILEVKFADMDAGPSPIGPQRSPSDNLYCKNIPNEWGTGESGKQELRNLFAAHGTVKECRIFPASTKSGQFQSACALVRMGSLEEAARAMGAINSWAACTGTGAGTYPILVRYADTPEEKNRKQAKRLRMSQSNPYDQYIPPDNHLPAGFTSFPTVFPSPTSVLAPAASTPHCAYLQPQPGPQQASAIPNGHTYSAAPAYMQRSQPPMSEHLAACNLPSAPHAHQQAASPSSPYIHQRPFAAHCGVQKHSTALYIKNLPADADKLYLYERFARFGAIHSVKVMTDDGGQCKGVGFVNYATYDDAPAPMKPSLQVCFGVLLGLTAADALSWPVCDQIYMSWTTDTPRLTGQYPFASLLMSCSGNLNIEGNPLDACINFGETCGRDAAAAFCRYMGWDGLSDDSLVIVPATGPVRALTGEWCVSPGYYIPASNITQAAQIKKTDSLECNRIDGVTCYRRREEMANWLHSNLASSIGQALPVAGVPSSPIPVTAQIGVPSSPVPVTTQIGVPSSPIRVTTQIGVPRSPVPVKTEIVVPVSWGRKLSHGHEFHG